MDVFGDVYLGTTANRESWEKSGHEDETQKGQMGGKELNTNFS